MEFCAHVSLLGKKGGLETLTSVYTPLRCQQKWAKSLCGCGRVVPTFYRSCRRLPPSWVWSSMLKSTTRDICSYLFGPSLVNPLRILGQKDCDRVLVHKVGNRMFYMKEVGTQKDIFLKTLSNHLFNSFDSHYTLATTLVIDDSPIKHMFNLSENVLLLPTWSYGGDGAATDSVLIEELLPYLLNLHRSQEGLAEFRSSHPLGRTMFYNDRQTYNQYSRIMKAIGDWESSSH